jgi:alpha-tubulin suppressor-like RCC1 family protein
MKTKCNLIQLCLLAAMLLPALIGEAQPTVTKIAAGGGHSLVLRSDGSLWAMGWNNFGQLGDGGVTATRDVPEEIMTSGVTAIAAGGGHSLFLKSDGSLWAMGGNQFGQLGDGTYANRNIPEQIVASNVTAIAAGDSFSLFIKSDGSLWAMGANDYGQLGDGTTDNGNYYTNRPEQIVASGVTAIAAGYAHSLFIKRHGNIFHTFTELWAMGFNYSGQLGDGTTNNRATPVLIQSYETPQLAGTSPVTAIAAGYSHSLFLKGDGSLWAMGDDIWGELGDGGAISSYGTNKPELIVASGVTTIAAGENASLFLKSDGSLWAMGDNYNGQLGDGTSDHGYYQTSRPEQIVSTNVMAIAAGGEFSLFLKSDGNLWAMGDDSVGELGDGTYITSDAAGDPSGVFSPEIILIVPPPALGITTYGSQPLLIFPTATYTNYLLQMTTNLASGNWVTVTNLIPIHAAIITNASGAAFFRLH